MPLAHGLLIGSCLVVALHSFKVVSMEGAVQLSPLPTFDTLRFEGTGITGGGIGAVLHLLGLVLGMRPTQRLTLGTRVQIVRRVIGEEGLYKGVLCSDGLAGDHPRFVPIALAT